MSVLNFGRARMPGGPPAPWWGFILAGVVYGALSGLALPPAGVWPLALVALVPLVWAGCRGAGGGGRAKRAAMYTAIGTLPFWFVEHWWLMNVAEAGYPLLSLYMGIFPAIFVWGIAHARRADWRIPMSLVVPLLWTSLEVLRGEFGLDGYSWFLLGHPLIDAPLLAAPAAIFGAYGVSFLCGVLAGAVADAAGWSGIPRPIGGIGALALLVVWPAMGWVGGQAARSSAQTRNMLRVGVVQTNLPQDNKMGWAIADRQKDMLRFIELTKQAAALRPTPDVILWPETMFPGRALNPEAVEQFRQGGVHYSSGVAVNVFHDDLVKAQGEIGIPMLVGCLTLDGDVLADLGKSGTPTHSREFNSVMLIDKGRVQPTRYDKIELTPFGEEIPHLGPWPSLQQAVLDFGAKGMEFNLSPGTRATGLDVPMARSDFDAPTVRVATPICFEATRAGLCRRLVRGAGDSASRSLAIINFSNDGWFGTWDAGRRQHMLAARWRCVELALPMVRCVNTGVSCQIDAAGRIVNEQLADKPGDNDRVEGVMMAVVPIEPVHSLTMFERMGLVPAYVVMAAGLAGTVVFWRRSRRVGGVS